MQTFALSTVAALIGGLLTYGLLRWLLWDVDIRALGSIVGLGALVSAAIAAWLARRRQGTERGSDAGR